MTCIVLITAVPCRAWWNPDWSQRVLLRIEQIPVPMEKVYARLSLSLRVSAARKGKDIRIIDANGKERARIITLSWDRKEADILFDATDSETCWLYYGNPSAPSPPISSLPAEGRLLLEDYYLPNAVTHGSWRWVSDPVISGMYAHTHEPAESLLHSFMLNPSVPFGKDDLLIQYLFLDPNDMPKEVMIEVRSRNEQVYFSWGEESFSWKGIEKKKMGPLPPSGRWCRIEVPLKRWRNSGTITGIGFFADGKVFWDKTSFNESFSSAVPICVEEYRSLVASGFTADVAGPYRFNGTPFFSLTLDGRLSSGAESWEWIIGEKRYKGPMVQQTFLGNEPLDVRLKVSNKGKVSIYEKQILPNKEVVDSPIRVRRLFHPSLLRAGEEVSIPFELVNVASEPLELSLSEGESFILFPGISRKRIVRTGREGLKIFFGTEQVLSFPIKELSLSDLHDIRVNGPFFESSTGSSVVVTIPSYRVSSSSLGSRSTKISLIGGVPPGFEKHCIQAFQKENHPVVIERIPCEALSGKLSLLTDILFLAESLKKELDYAVWFPPLDPLRKRYPLEQWESSYDASLFLLSSRAKQILAVTPFPSMPWPETLLPYAEAAREVAVRRGAALLDLYALYTMDSSWKEKYFHRQEPVYDGFPNEEGLRAAAQSLVVAVLRLESGGSIQEE
ncbi:MAG: hypothetical protein WDA18_04410 [Candidatus Ratteibacteria bacterium]